MKIGFIGLGIMGRPMAKNLLKAGYDLTVYDLNAQAVQDVAASGAKAGKSVKEVAAGADVLITMLPNSPHVKQVLLGHLSGENNTPELALSTAADRLSRAGVRLNEEIGLGVAWRDRVSRMFIIE